MKVRKDTGMQSRESKMRREIQNLIQCWESRGGSLQQLWPSNLLSVCLFEIKVINFLSSLLDVLIDKSHCPPTNRRVRCVCFLTVVITVLSKGP